MENTVYYIDRYEFACFKDEFERKLIKLSNIEIQPIKSSLQLKKQQIEGLSEIVINLGNEIDILKKENISIKNELKNIINIFNLLIYYLVSIVLLYFVYSVFNLLYFL